VNLKDVLDEEVSGLIEAQNDAIEKSLFYMGLADHLPEEIRSLENAQIFCKRWFRFPQEWRYVPDAVKHWIISNPHFEHGHASPVQEYGEIRDPTVIYHCNVPGWDDSDGSIILEFGVSDHPSLRKNGDESSDN
jgi:hypothetical protein